MKKADQISVDSDKDSQIERKPESSEVRKSGTVGVREGSDAQCRCKEVSKKSMPQLLKLMLRDLAFWKKARS